MKRFLLFIFFNFCFMAPALAQEIAASDYIELHKKLKESKNDLSQVKILLELSHFHLLKAERVAFPKSLDSVFIYTEKIEKLSRALKNNDYLGYAYLYCSQAHKIAGLSFASAKSYERAAKYAQQAIDQFTKNKDKLGISRAYIALIESTDVNMSIKDNITFAKKIRKICKENGTKTEEAKMLVYLAVSYGNVPNLDESLALLKESLKIYKSANYKQVQYPYSMIGAIYNESGDFPMAIKYVNAATKLVEKYHNTEKESAEVYNYAGTVYRSLGKNDIAVENFQKALAISKLYSDLGTVAWYEMNILDIQFKSKANGKTLEYVKDLEKNFSKFTPSVQQNVLASLLNSYIKLKDYKNAKKYADRVSQLLPQLSPRETFEFIQLYQAMVLYNLRIKNYDVSKYYANKYLEQAKKIGSKEKQIHIYHVLFRIDSIQGNYLSAIKNLNTEHIYRDSLFNSDKNKQVAELEIKYKTEKKDNDLLIKDKANLTLQKQSDQANFIKNISVGGVVVLFVIAGLLLYNYRIKQRNNVMLEKQKEEINQKNNSLTTLLGEKEWLVKEIHHRVKNNLQMVMSLLNTQSHYLKDEGAMLAIKNTQHRIHSMALIHKKLYQSENVVAIDMKNYINELVDYLKESFGKGQRIRFSTNVAAVQLDASQAIPLGLILNEAITNAIKYAFPDNADGEISVSLSFVSDNKYKLTISDNGIGIVDEFVFVNESTLGMKLIKGLAEDIEAKLTMTNKNGFTLSFEFDCDAKKILLNNAENTAIL